MNMLGWSTACFGAFKKAGDGFYSKNSLDLLQNEDATFLSDDKKGTSFVELEKKDGMTLGLIISGGIDKNSRPKVSNLRPGSIAHRSDALAIGDHIVSVNGILTSKLKHEEIINLLRNAGSKVTLEIEYELPNSTAIDSVRVSSKVIQVKLDKEKDSFGFTLRGGSNADSLKSRPLIITHIRFGGPADRTGILKVGDRLIGIDGINMSSFNLQDALQFIKQLKQNALFTIEYDVSCIDAVKNATGPLLVEIDRTPGCLIGINLSSLSVPEHLIVIESIRQASIAERCGALHVGDHVLAIDGIKVDLMTCVEAMQLLRSSVGETVKLEILPVSQMALRNTFENYAKQGEHSFHCGFHSTTVLTGLRSSGGLNGCTPMLDPVMPYCSNGSLNSNVNGSATVGHADRTEVILHADHKGFGINVQSASCSSDILTAPPIISCVEQGSPAQRSGVLQVGDRILAINGESTEGTTLDKIANMIANSLPCLILIIEFDVAEAVVPSSGIFVMKLPKRDADLGISITASSNRQRGEPLIIADIKKGSVAHRTGTIQPGDKLLAINSLRTEHCTIEDALAILHTCTDIVKLRIRKDETFSEDPDATCAIVYTVELVRHGGPLGITVSGTKEPFDPIFISGLTENGLAERTGALHVGDRILAINGNSLRGKTLNEAICILQTCGDAVTIKISKCLCPERFEDENVKLNCVHCQPDSQIKTLSTPLPSIDSAVDSWDSCNPELAPDVTYAKSDLYYETCNLGNISVSYPNTLVQSKHKRLNLDSDDKQLFWNQKNLRPSSYAGGHFLPSDEEKESWTKVLEDLQTCGQSRLLRQLEQSILGFDENANEEEKSISDNNSENLKCSPDTLSENNLQELNSQIEQLDVNKVCFSDVVEQMKRRDSRHSVCNDSTNFYYPPSSSFSAPLPIEIHKVTLFKDQIYEDFGFSLSDGKYESGVYINSIRPGGPADLSGLIKPLDRILQVNNVKTYNAGLIVPLIASSGDRIELVISRPAYDNESSSEGTLGATSPWMEDFEDSSLLHSISFTKTL